MASPCVGLYFAFPFAADRPEFRFEGPNSVNRPLRDQFPGSNSNYYSVQHWAEAADGESGIVLCPLDSHLLEFGGLWPCYASQAHHGVTPPDFGRPFGGADDMTRGDIYSSVLDNNLRTNCHPVQQGELLFRYALTTHVGRPICRATSGGGWPTLSSRSCATIPAEGLYPSLPAFCRIDADHVLGSACA